MGYRYTAVVNLVREGFGMEPVLHSSNHPPDRRRATAPFSVSSSREVNDGVLFRIRTGSPVEVSIVFFDLNGRLVRDQGELFTDGESAAVDLYSTAFLIYNNLPSSVVFNSSPSGIFLKGR